MTSAVLAATIVPLSERAVGDTATALELKTDGNYIPAPGVAVQDLTVGIFADQFAAQGFNSPEDVAFVLLSREGEATMWAIGTDQEVGDNATFTRIA